MEFTLDLRLCENLDETLNKFENVKIEDIVKCVESTKRTGLGMLNDHQKKISKQKLNEQQKYILYKYGKIPTFFYLYVTRTK
jgi:hypothetical protein